MGIFFQQNSDKYLYCVVTIHDEIALVTRMFVYASKRTWGQP